MITICATDGLERALRWKPHQLISFLDPGGDVHTPSGIAPGCHLRLWFDDVTERAPGVVVPAEPHIRRLIWFIRDFLPNDRIIIHCADGIGRSQAALLIVLSYFNPGEEFAVAHRVRGRVAQVKPNPRMIDIGDRVLRSNGRLGYALRSMREPRPAHIENREASFLLVIPEAYSHVDEDE